MAPLDGADRDWAAFEVPRPVKFRTAAQHAHLVVVLVKTDPAIQILFERQVLDKRVAWEVAHDPIVKEVGNNPIHRMAHNRKKLRWLVENSSDIEGKMRADHATHRVLPFDRQLMELFGNLRGGSHQERRIGHLKIE